MTFKKLGDRSTEEELRSKPCRKGHSKRNGYRIISKNGIIRIRCPECHKETKLRYELRQIMSKFPYYSPKNSITIEDKT